MTSKSFEAIRRADHALMGALALFIATISAAAGAASVYTPHTEQSPRAVIVQAAKTSVAPTADQVAAAAPVRAPLNEIDASNVQPASAPAVAVQDPAMQELLREHRCLSDALYFEARGEGKQGEMAIAEVIFHRLRNGTYGHSICSVVYAGAPRHGCQFSFACDGISLRRGKAYGAWQRAQYLAAQIMVGQARLMNVTGGATNFHAISASPDWAYEMERTTQIGNHIFYRHLPRSRPL